MVDITSLRLIPSPSPPHIFTLPKIVVVMTTCRPVCDKAEPLAFCLAAYFNDIAVGAVCCRVDHSQNQKRLYIMTLGCLAPYRRLGIGTGPMVSLLHIFCIIVGVLRVSRV